MKKPIMISLIFFIALKGHQIFYILNKPELKSYFFNNPSFSTLSALLFLKYFFNKKILSMKKTKFIITEIKIFSFI